MKNNDILFTTQIKKYSMKNTGRLPDFSLIGKNINFCILMLVIWANGIVFAENILLQEKPGKKAFLSRHILSCKFPVKVVLIVY